MRRSFHYLAGASMGAIAAIHLSDAIGAQLRTQTQHEGFRFPASRVGARKRAGHRLRMGSGVRAMPSGCTSTLRKAMREERRRSLARSVA